MKWRWIKRLSVLLIEIYADRVSWWFAASTSKNQKSINLMNFFAYDGGKYCFDLS